MLGFCIYRNLGEMRRRVSPLRATYFLYEQKVGKESLRGKMRSAPNAEGRVLRSSVFP